MQKTALLRYENSNNQVLKDESIALNWNSWYFFPEHVVNVSLLSIQSFLTLERGLFDKPPDNNNFTLKRLKELSIKTWNIPNTGSYSTTITKEISPGHYIFAILNGVDNYSSIQDLVENGLVSKPIIVNQKPTREQKIVLTYPKASRPFGFSDIINVNFKTFVEESQIGNQQNPVSVHIYSVNPNDPSSIEPKQNFETISNDISIVGLGLEKCPTYYKITAKMLQHPFHQDSSQYFWVLPKNPLPITLSNADLLSKKQLCLRQNNKYGMFPTPTEFGILLIIASINIIGLVTLGILINKLNNTRKRKRKLTNGS